MLLDDDLESGTVVDPREAAESAGLVYVSDEEPGIRRRKSGTGFTYVKPGGGTVKDPATLKRIRSLAIPPAYTDVWICAKAIRHKVVEHMALRGLPREKVLATVVNLLEMTLIRVGNEDYAKQNKSYGLTTLRDKHVEVDGSELRFDFKGKSGKMWKLRVKDRRIAKIIRACQDLPGQDLFQYIDEDGERQSVTSADVNAYLREITGRDVTAKDFRTWSGTVMAAWALAEFETFDSDAKAKKNIRAAIEKVSAKLGN